MMKRWDVLGPLCGIATGLVAFAFGVQGWRPVLIGVIVAGLFVWAPRFWPEGRYLRWPRVGKRIHRGGSHQVSRLASSISRRNRSGARPDASLQHRLRRLATTKLNRLGISWDDPRVPELLGPAVHEALTTETFSPTIDEIAAIITAIENLDAPADTPGTAHQPTGTSHYPAPAGGPRDGAS
ncbi:hypothetical protein EF847_16765 [Actinobacteria bacterium YIM 96077]|uniref:Uncharacterized protein n=1 Tax=Phytoactinopolyspora halophila TaxID=1981511 RepID=A0A329QE41_9ACTN|nr:hypothetical protein [Phytoactinopolyspora halophila]AYY14105.1 hypothetical protein EF847_16765 [Actinobacteria bacterium YIM 96077]RAW09959.1 hypothetical protein DPM12_19950 [Phytoactinopolyspora halophila]